MMDATHSNGLLSGRGISDKSNQLPSEASPVPICSTLAEDEARSSVRFRAAPEDERDNHMFLSSVSLLPHDRHVLDSLVEEHLANLKGGKSGKLLEQLRWHLEQYFLNLGRAQLCHKWLVVPEHTKHYTKQSSFLGKQGFQFNNCNALNDYFRSIGLVEHKEGKDFDKGSMAARVFPTGELSEELAVLALYTQQQFTGEYVRINKPESAYQGLVDELPNNHPDLLALNEINEFMVQHTWALKAPIELIYSRNIMRGGRLYTAYQNLPSRKLSVRKNTLLNGEPIVEVDFNANHLRLALAILAKEDAGDTPYEDICELAGEAFAREQAKAFVTIAIGAQTRSEALGAAFRKKINQDKFNALEAATIRRYPNLPLYDGDTFKGGLGVYLQSIEGAILKDVMLEGVKRGIPCIPVHDALAINPEHRDWAIDVMTKAWIANTNCCTAIPRLS